MLSPFPGMDPYIEGHEWQNFHGRYIVALSDQLVPLLRPKYVIRSEERIYLVHDTDDQFSGHIIPDLAIFEPDITTDTRRGSGGAALLNKPISITLPMPEHAKERYLTIRKRESMEVVAVIELLSPSNKRPNSFDRETYLQKRAEVMRSGANLVELDMLRGGQRLPTNEPLPQADFFAIICRSYERPRASAYAWSLRQTLPSIPIPLADGDEDALLNLQQAFDMVYNHAGFDYSLDYHREVEPRLSPTDKEWADQILSDYHQ